MPAPLVLRACSVYFAPEGASAVRADGRTERLTSREADLLRYLVAHADRTVPRDELLTAVWRYAPSVVSRAVDTAVRRVREKVEGDAQHPDHVLTSHGLGYRFLAAPSETPVAEEDPFVGRQLEVDALLAAVRSGRTLLLHGAPGVGKTRLARHVAWRMASSLGSVVVVDLTDARDLAQVAQALAAHLGLEGADPGPVALRRAGAALGARGPSLVLLDNCEGACAAVGDALASWRAAAPDARFVATSREPVGGVDDAVELGPMVLEDAVELFATLARQARPDFVLDEARPVVEMLVERLERLPLAIALAAGRASALSPRAILDRLDDRFRLLASRSRDGTARQRTLRAALDSSWDLLGEVEREVFAACSAFRGGFDRAAARAVVGRDDTEAVLASLCARSLLEVRGDRIGGYAFVLEYAGERLAADPAAMTEIHRRHARHFADRVRAIPSQQRPRALSRDRANLVVAVERCAANGWGDEAGATAIGALDVVGYEGPFELAVSTAQAALAGDGLSPPERVVLLLRLGTLEFWTGIGDPAARITDGVALARTLGDPGLLSSALRTMASWSRRISRDQWASLYREALVLAREPGVEPNILCGALSAVATAVWEAGENDEALALWEELLAIGERHPDEVSHHVSLTHGSLGHVYLRLGRFDDARASYERALVGFEDEGHLREVAAGLGALGNLEVEVGRWAEARARYVQALQIVREVGVAEAVTHFEGALALCDLGEGNLGSARERLEKALHRFEGLGEHRQAGLARGNLGEVELAAGRVEEAASCLGEAVRSLRSLGDGRAASEISASLAAALVWTGRTAEARAVLAEAEPDARARRNPLIVAKLLARRGLVELAEGLDAAATLAEAEQAGAGTGPASDTQRAIAELRAAIAGR